MIKSSNVDRLGVDIILNFKYKRTWLRKSFKSSNTNELGLENPRENHLQIQIRRYNRLKNFLKNSIMKVLGLKNHLKVRIWPELFKSYILLREIPRSGLVLI